MTRLIDVTTTLFLHSEEMLPEHIEFLNNFIKLQRDFGGNASAPLPKKKGDHYSTCCWSNDVEGPNTCSCGSLELDIKKAIAIVDLYHYALIGRKKEKEHCCVIV